MNILPKKSWHVRSKKNIEKVRKDEEKAAKELLEKEIRVGIAESEARSDALRQTARKRRQQLGLDDEDLNGSEDQVSTNVVREEVEKAARPNKRHEEEKRQEKEKQEKAIGLLNYLGQGSNELENRTPWYSEPRSEKLNANNEQDLKRKKCEDPLEGMNKYLEATEKYEAHKSGKTHVKKKPTEKRVQESKSKSGKKSIEQLRKERLEREQSERMKQNQLMDKINNVVREDEEPKKDKRQKYSSQYYEHIIKF